jgi:hypothetical protein
VNGNRPWQGDGRIISQFGNGRIDLRQKLKSVKTGPYFAAPQAATWLQRCRRCAGGNAI